MDFIKIINILYVMDSTDIADFFFIMCMLWILTNFDQTACATKGTVELNRLFQKDRGKTAILFQ